jgi:tetratricopeptide (TPR) repeat protein
MPSKSRSEPKLSRRKLWLFRFITAVVLPSLVLLLLELALRLGGYGYETKFFKPFRIGETECLVENDKFGLRFFPPALARSPPPVVMRARKAPGTIRIFLLGESAALGDPRPAYGPGRYLKVLLEQRFPEKSFEIVCVAMTAINSHAILPIAEECARYEPDAWIVYMGNNEMVGPFGATTVFGARAPPRALVRLGLAAQRLRVGQLLTAWAQKLRAKANKGNSWGGMEMFVNNRVAPDDSRREAVYRNFAANLSDILSVLQRSRAPAILNTVAVNLRDCAPFSSITQSNVAPGQLARFNSIFAQAQADTAAGNLESSSALFREAATLQPAHAEAQFRWAQLLLAQTNTAAAEHFKLACDNDALPFRATATINSLITNTAGRRPAALLDAAALFATNAARFGNVPGEECFYEHVHFNFDGNYLLGRAWAEKVAGLLGLTAPAASGAGWASQTDCEARLGLTDWNRVSVLEDMALRLQQPPFTGQLNHTQRLASLRAAIASLRSGLDTNRAVSARLFYEQAIAGAPQDYRLRENFAEFLEAVGDLRLAANQWRQVAELAPHHHLGYFQTGRLLALQRNGPEAKTNLLHALTLRPDLSEGWMELGKVFASENNHRAALSEFQKSRELFPQDPRAYYYMGKSLSQLGERAAAIQNFRRAVELRPGSWQARYALGEELAFDLHDQEAMEQFQEVLRLNPNHASAHLNLGVALFKLGKRPEAKAQFAETLRLEPGNASARSFLRQLESAPDANR